MNDITLLRELHDTLPEARPEALNAARALLLAAADAELSVAAIAAARTRRRQRLVVTGLSAAAAAAVVVAGSVTGWGPAGHPTPASAAALLRHASVETAATPDPTVGANEWLRVTTKTSALALLQAPNSQRITGGYEDRSITDDFIPGDTNGRWLERTTRLKPGTVYGGASVRTAARDAWVMAKQEGLVNTERARKWFAIPELGGGFSSADTRTLPLDPDELRTYLEKNRGHAETKREAALESIATILARGTASTKLRSSMYQVLASLPGITIVNRQATLDGRTGTAFALDDPSSDLSFELIVDPQTGRYLGEREVSRKREGAIPAGTVQNWTAVSTMVVSQAPTADK